MMENNSDYAMKILEFVNKKLNEASRYPVGVSSKDFDGEPDCCCGENDPEDCVDEKGCIDCDDPHGGKDADYPLPGRHATKPHIPEPPHWQRKGYQEP